MLRWKYFTPRGSNAGPRSFVALEEGRLAAHIGVTTTEFVSPSDPGLCVSAVHPVDWLSTQSGGMLGTMLMLKAFSQGRVQYSTGSTEVGNRILRGCGFEEIVPLPNFYKFFHPVKRETWNLIHGKQGFPRNIVMFALDMARQQIHPGVIKQSGRLTLRGVKNFPEEIKSPFQSGSSNLICTSRDPALLNYLLKAPGGRFSGWLIHSHNACAGFALTSITHRDGLRMGNIVDCFLRGHDPAEWRATMRLLTEQLQQDGCDVARAICSAPWMQAALRETGYFPRGRGGFFLRDPQKLISRDRSFHITLLDGDLAF
jgi:hypothetical protein